MSEPMTEAERAVAAMLALDTELDPSIGVEGFNTLARRVVAAVRPILAAEALEAAVERLLDQADLVRTKFPHQSPGHNRSYGLSEAASMLRADAAALRTTTSEKENR
jgi:hypothetical protein